MSEIIILPPGFSTRKASRNTLSFSGDRLITQLEMMTSTLSLEEDPAAAAAEWLGEFRSDVEGYVGLEVIEDLIIPDRLELPPGEGMRYVGFTDPSGGSKDSFTLAIAHSEGDRLILDCIREKKPPFAPTEVVKEFAETLKSYHLKEVTGDRYAGVWPTEAFAKHGIQFKISDQTKSELYGELLPKLNSRQVELLDHQKLKTQLLNLERRTSRSGRDNIDHDPGPHDDVCNAAAGALIRL